MRVAVKFVLATVLALVLLRAFEGVLTVRLETARLNAAIERDAQLLAQMVSTSVRSAWRAEGRERALELIEAMNVEGHSVQTSWAPYGGENGLYARLDAEALADLEDGRVVSKRLVKGEKGYVQYFFVPVGVRDADGAIQLAETLADRSRYVRRALAREALAGGAAVLVSGAVLLLLGIAVIGRPLSLLRERIRRIGEGDLGGRVALGGRDELSVMADGLNEMCERIAASRDREHAETEKRIQAMEQVRHLDRLTTIGRLAAGIAHELGTPLNVIGRRAGMISDGTIPPDSGKVQENAETIKSQAERMTTIVRHLLDFARQRPPKRVATDGAEVARQAVHLVSCLGYKAAVRLEAKGEPGSLVAEMDPVQIQQVMTNLFENALQAMPDGGEVLAEVWSAQAAPPGGVPVPAGRFLQLSVSDAGPGIPEGELPSVFDPFFTTKDVGQGTGLGLSIAYGIVREHGGWISVVSEVGRGTRFTVFIPQENAP